MKPVGVILAVEDQLSEAVARRILDTVGVAVLSPTGGKGKSHLARTAAELNRTAQKIPVLMLIDQDDPSICPPELIAQLVKCARAPRFLLRVVVMEIEAWVLADRDAAAKLLKVPVNRIPQRSDEIRKPKEEVVRLARRSRSARIRKDLVPAPGNTRKVGPLFNAMLCDFVNRSWSPERAARVSPSLRRTLDRLRELG
jgi:hypothetical protein